MSTAIFCIINSHNRQMLNIHSSSINGVNVQEPNKNFNTQAEFYIPTSKQPFKVDRSAMCFETIIAEL